MQRNDGLQFARGVACLSVVAGHAAFFGGLLSKTDPPKWIWQLPSLGVFLFFVLSGYLMGALATNGRSEPGRFARHRFLRIYPPFWAAVVISILVMLALGKPVPAPDFAVLALSPINFGGGAYDIPAWTLMYETVFYVLVFALIAGRATKRTVLIAASVWVVAIILFHLPGAPAYSQIQPGAFILLSSMNLLFIAGAVVGILGTRALDRVPVAAFFVASAALWWLAMQIPSPFVVAMLIYAASSTAALIGFSRVQVKSRVLVSIGNASYGIYLVHYFLISALVVVAQRLGLRVEFPAAFAGLALASIALTWGFGSFEYAIYARVSGKRAPLPVAAAVPQSAA